MRFPRTHPSVALGTFCHLPDGHQLRLLCLQAEAALVQPAVAEHVMLQGLTIPLESPAIHVFLFFLLPTPLLLHTGRGGTSAASSGRACHASRLDHTAGARPAHHLPCGHELQHLRAGQHHGACRSQAPAAAGHHQARQRRGTLLSVGIAICPCSL